MCSLFLQTQKISPALDILSKTSIFSSDSKGDGPIDPFDLKSILLWMAIAIFVVFGVVKILRLLLKRSEQTTEEWRQSNSQHQQVSSYFLTNFKFYILTNFKTTTFLPNGM